MKTEPEVNKDRAPAVRVGLKVSEGATAEPPKPSLLGKLKQAGTGPGTIRLECLFAHFVFCQSGEARKKSILCAKGARLGSCERVKLWTGPR